MISSTSKDRPNRSSNSMTIDMWPKRIPAEHVLGHEFLGELARFQVEDLFKDGGETVG